MRINHQKAVFGIVKSIMFFNVCFLLFIISSCTIKDIIIESKETPEGIWTYPGGSVEPMSLVFHSDGRLEFVGGFQKFVPATWQYNKRTKKLKIKISNYDKYATNCGDDYEKEYACLNYNGKTDTFECKWTSKTKSIGFLGWNFLRK